MTDERSLPFAAQSEARIAAIALVGFMGAGKSCVGQALARRLRWRFADLDRIIERRDARTIEQIFKQSGETAFRELELSVLSEIIRRLKTEPFVIALGGGAFAQSEVRTLLFDSGVAAVFLDAPVEELYRRSEQPEVMRPLRQNLEQFRELYEKRRSAYGEARLRIDTSEKEIDTLAEEIMSALGMTTSSGVNS